jgi:precorrin-6x reductase
MRVLIVGGVADASELAHELERSGLAVERRDDDSPARDGAAEIEDIARDLRELESTPGQGKADAIIVASSSAVALAAVLVATKEGIPVARLEASGDSGEGDSNARLIRQLADTALPGDPAAIIRWVRGGYPARA